MIMIPSPLTGVSQNTRFLALSRYLSSIRNLSSDYKKSNYKKSNKDPLSNNSLSPLRLSPRSPETNHLRKSMLKGTTRLFTASALSVASLLVASTALVHADSQAPSVVNSISGQYSQNTITLTWNRPWDNQTVNGYNIYRNNSYYDTAFSTNYTDNAVGANTAYNYQITAFDGSGNYSSMSEVFTVNSGTGAAPASSNEASNSNGNSRTASNALTAPANLRGTETAPYTVQWQWDWVPGATQYEVSVDGNIVALTTDQQHFSRDLWQGDHSLSVKSVSADGNYSGRSDTLKLYVQGGSIQNDVAPPPPSTTPAPQAQQDFGPDDGLIDPQSWSYGEVYQKEGYELAFSDEFNSYSINPARWNTQLRWDGEFNGERYEYRVINDEAQFYVNPLSNDPEHTNLLDSVYNPFKFDGSRVAIRSELNPLKNRNDRAGHGPLRDMVARQHFLSGALSTYDKFYRKYGYFEARMKIPSHVGTFPAFWLYHQKRKTEGTQRSEIDIMENLGHAPWYIYNTFHYSTNVSPWYAGDANFLRPYPQGQIYTGTDYSQDYHVYAVEWEPSKITWLIDGVKVSELSHGAVDFEELYININMAMGGNWTNYAENAGGLGRSEGERFPAWYDTLPENFQNPALEIDYVRVYRRR